jgi:single-strand DNA-binding protein
MYQQIIIVGNVGRDPEMRYTADGTGVCSFTVAVNKRTVDRTTNERKDSTTWFKVSAWRQLAEVCSQYVRKGMQIFVVGEVRATAYVTQAGEARASLEITAREVKFLSRRDEEGAPPRSSYADDQQGDYAAAEDVDDIPF